MTFPTVAGTATSITTPAGTSQVISLPSDIEPGNLLIAIFAYSGSFSTNTWPAGWTRVQHSATNNVGGDWGFRRADGTEGASFTVTSDSREAAHMTLKIAGAGHLSPKSQVFWNSGSSSTPSIPGIAGPDGAKDYLWIEACAADSGFVATAASTNYSNLQTSDSGSTANVSAAISVARRELNTGGTESPGTMTLEGSEGWLGLLICVHPFVTQISERRQLITPGRRTN